MPGNEEYKAPIQRETLDALIDLIDTALKDKSGQIPDFMRTEFESTRDRLVEERLEDAISYVFSQEYS